MQADILKEYIAQKEWIFPIRPSMRVMRDMIVWSARNLARYNPINISGYHISEAGATSVQELAFTMANAIAYVEEVTRAGVPVDEFAPRLAFYFVAQADFFEEVAKFRAARRIYARLMKERFGATKAESMRLRFHCQTAAATLTKAQPLNNIIRTALQALSAVLGGAQSLHTNGMDEAYAIPSEEAMKVALRTQQIIAMETRVPQVVDPLGGSYYVEALTNRIEAEVLRILAKVDAMGGTIKAIEEGFFQHEIADSAYDFARRKAAGEQAVIGVNTLVEPSEPPPLPIHKVDPAVEARQIGRLKDDARAARPGARGPPDGPARARGARARDQHHAGDDRAREGARLAGRDRGAAPPRLGRLHRAAGVLMPPRPFRIEVPEATLADLRERLARARWPDQAPGAEWAFGTSLAYMKELTAYWKDRYDWRAHEARLNGFRQFTAPGGRHRSPLHPRGGPRAEPAPAAALPRLARLGVGVPQDPAHAHRPRALRRRSRGRVHGDRALAARLRLLVRARPAALRRRGDRGRRSRRS